MSKSHSKYSEFCPPFRSRGQDLPLLSRTRFPWSVLTRRGTPAKPARDLKTTTRQLPLVIFVMMFSRFVDDVLLHGSGGCLRFGLRMVLRI